MKRVMEAVSTMLLYDDSRVEEKSSRISSGWKNGAAKIELSQEAKSDHVVTKTRRVIHCALPWMINSLDVSLQAESNMIIRVLLGGSVIKGLERDYI